MQKYSAKCYKFVSIFGMRRTFNAFKRVIIVILVSVVSLYAGLYLLLSIPFVQQKIKSISVHELQNILHTELDIERISIEPFNKVALHKLYLKDLQGDTLLYADRLSAGFELLPLLEKRLVFTTIQFFGFDIRLNRQTPKDKLNFQFIADAFLSKEREKREKNIDLKIRSILIRRGNLSYDILSEPYHPKGQFDKNHIRISNLLSTLSIKALKTDSANIYLKRLSFDESSGFKLNELSFKAVADSSRIAINQFNLALPNSDVKIDSTFFDYSRVDSLHHLADSAYIYLNIDDSPLILSDLATFAPALKRFEKPINLHLNIDGSINHLQMNSLRIRYTDGISLTATGNVDGISDPESAYIFGQISDLYISPGGLNTLIQSLSSSSKEFPAAQNLGYIRFRGDISGFFNNLVAYGKIQTPRGNIHSDLLLSYNFSKKIFSYKGSIATELFDLSNLFENKNQFGKISFNLHIDGNHPKNGKINGAIEGEIGKIHFKRYPYENIRLNGHYSNTAYDGWLEIDDPNGKLSMYGIIDLQDKTPIFKFTARGENIKVHELKLTPKYADSSLSFGINANFVGNSFDTAEGELSLDSTSFVNGDKQFFLEKFSIVAKNAGTPQSLQINSDILHGEISGQYSFKTLYKSFLELLRPCIPSLVKTEQEEAYTNNKFQFHLSFNNTEPISSALELPVSFGEEGSIDGFFDSEGQKFRVNTVLPEFSIKRSRFESSQLVVEKTDDRIHLQMHTNGLNRKNQYILLSLNADAQGDSLNTQFNWSNIAEATFSGKVSATTHFLPGTDEHPLNMDIAIHPTKLILNDTIWNLNPAKIEIDTGIVSIKNFEIRRDSQYLSINGRASKTDQDSVKLTLNDIDLDYIFGSLNIKNVTFGGRATGDFIATNFSDIPIMSTEKFEVKNFSYNDAPIGDLNLFSRWDNENKGILLQGKISQPDVPDTQIKGHIFPTGDSLSLYFDTHKLNLAFMQPFVSKIMQNFEGDAYGKIHFFGHFKALNVVGDAWLQNLRFGIEYLNTAYWLSDSIHLRPTSIYFNNVQLNDAENHTAQVTGVLNHSHFKNMDYNIQINNARNLLVFNITEQQNPIYYGRIYGTGVGTIRGDMSRTNIDVNMSTNENSKFTFALSDNETASDYQFITFVDRRQLLAERKDSTENRRPRPTSIPGAATKSAEKSLNINLQVDVSPQSTLYLIMDPDTGDEIKANGSGSLRIEYDRLSDLKLYGTYTLEKGNYNFSLQDVISREFAIQSGSSVTFRGNPKAADLSISASYTVTANLQDLDESFADDKELTRTNIPVQTILSVNGDLQRPELAFDIQLPSLSQDIERRVKNIISTDDMMNRQIIYLLALGKFYTPDYMNVGQNRSNELASVASSTLSSQLNNLLSQISDNWNIGTNIRSDKGDFSDVEFELALSSQLLNNRLIFNGNFGYRDNQINDNLFIGDFDLEYLLSKSGNLRLKAYNHYNDKNYYIKSALTTQGVGVIFKRDFVRFSDLFYRIRNQINRIRKKRLNKKQLETLSIPREQESEPLIPETEVTDSSPI